MAMDFKYILSSASAIALLASQSPAEAAQCTDLAGRRFGDAVILSADAIPAGQAQSLPELRSAASAQPMLTASAARLPAFCRITGAVHPASTSDIRFEVWAPLANWNRRYWATGNGGWAGYINYQEMAQAAARGYATSSTDTGHVGSPLDPRGLAAPEALKDWTDRAIHLTSVASKQVIAFLYDTPLRTSYFSGCSNGGRQALISAQRYPEDFDGIIAGAPAYVFPTIASNNRAAWLLSRDPAATLTMPKLVALHEAVLKQCDALDGLADRLVSDPSSCKLQLSRMRCTGGETDMCLTDPQIATATRLYNGTGGDFTPARDFSDGFMAGSELNWLVVAHVADANLGWIKLKIHPEDNWSLADFDPLRDPLLIRDSSTDLDPGNPDLSRFAARGGKLIVYTGMAETLVPYRSTVAYVDKVNAFMGTRAQDSVAFFPVPGRGHCMGGPLQFFNEGGGADLSLPTERDLPGTLQAWVENGRRPDRILVRNTAPDASEAGAAEATRPLCAYPKVARWSGKGDTNDARSFECKSPG